MNYDFEILSKIAKDVVVGQSRVVIVDLPYGGVHYKYEKENHDRTMVYALSSLKSIQVYPYTQ